VKQLWLRLVLVLVPVTITISIASPGQAGAEVTGRPAIQRFVPEA